MKILIATGIYPPDIGGPATYTKKIADAFSRRGISITVVSYGARTRSPENFRLVTVSRKLPKGIRHLMYFFKILKYARHVDYIYAQDPVSVGVPVLVASKLLRKKYVLKIVGDYAWEQGVARFGVVELLDKFLLKTKKYKFPVRILMWLERHVAARATLIVVPSNYLKSVVERWGGARQIVVIPNSIKRANLPSCEEARKTLGLDGFVFLSVGRLVRWKGFSMLLELASEMPKSPDFKIIIVGDGPERAALEGLRKRLNLSERVALVGAMPEEVLETYMAAADVFVLNTGYEGFSHQILEAFGAGLPVVTTLAGGNKEIVQPGKNALVAEFGNKIEWRDRMEKLIGDENLRETLRRGARETAEASLFEDMISRTLEEFKKL